MPGIAIKIAQHRAEGVECAVDQLQIDCAEAEQAWNVEQVVAEAADLVFPIIRAASHFKPPFSGQTVPEQIASAQIFAFVLNRISALFPRVRELARDVVRRGYSVDGMEKFDASELEIGRIRSRFIGAWPMPDENHVKRAKEQLAAGQFHVL